MRLRSLCLSLVVLAVVTGGSGLVGENQAHADARLVIKQPRYDRQIELNIHLSAYYGYSGIVDHFDAFADASGYGVGPGIQLLFPIVKNAIPTLNNPMYLGFFADFLLQPVGGGYTVLSFAFGPVFQWRFVIFDLFQSGSFSAFANLGVGLWPWFYRDYYADHVGFYLFPLFQLGGQLQFTRRVGMTLTFGYPSISLGLNLAF